MNEEIEKILIQLDECKLPFKKYSFTQKGGNLRLLGKGGFALVYEGESRSSHKEKYAIKVIGFSDKRVNSEFFNSVVSAQKELGQFQNNIVRVYDYNELNVWIDDNNKVIDVKKTEEGKLEPGCLRIQFIAMEKIDSILIHSKSGKARLTPAALASFDEKEIIKLAYNIGTALKLAHDKKILHRDVKLENIFYSPKGKNYKLGDFGIAKVTDDGTASTVTFTKGYGAPEVVGSLDDKYDNTADIYSLGMVLFVLLNKLKFPESDGYNVNSRVQYSRGYMFPYLESCSQEFCQVIGRMCAYNPDDRYQSMDEALLALDGVNINPDVPYKKKHKGAAFVIGTFCMMIGAIAWKLSYAPNMVLAFPVVVYILIALGLGKFIHHLFKRETGWVSFLILGVGIYMLVSTGFSWLKLIMVLLVVFSSGNASFIAASSFLMVNITYLLKKSGGQVAQDFAEYHWLAILMLSLALVLYYLYGALEENDRKLTALLFKKNQFWIIVCLGYVAAFFHGVSIKCNNVWLYEKIWGVSGIQFLKEMQLEKVGIAGATFSIVWMVREKILSKMENRNRIG